MWGPGWWGPGPWMMGFGWIFSLIGLAMAFLFAVAMLRAICKGGGPMVFMGGGHGHESEKVTDLQRQVGELREDVHRLKTAR